MNSELTEITVIGEDDTGLVAQITKLLFEHGANVENLDQAVRDDVFRMTMHAETTEIDCSREELRDELEDLCDALGVDVRIRYPETDEQQSLAVLVTKESHCLEALLDEAKSGDLDANVEVVIGNHSRLRPLAEEHDVPFFDIGDEDGTPDEDELLDLLDAYDVDLIALARYIRILSPEVVFRYQNRIINVHPSLLPAFPGASAYMQAIEAGVRVAGVTAHYVTPELDQGPIITQRAFNVPNDPTEEELRRRGQPLEAEALVEAIKLHLDDNLVVARGKTHVREEGEDVQLGLSREVEQLLPDEPVDSDSISPQTLVSAEPSDD